MELIKKALRRTLCPFPSITIHEYDMTEAKLGGGVAELDGRYPEEGYVMNEAIPELTYILSGTGKLLRPEGEVTLAEGDMVLLLPGEVYAWEGKMSLFMANAPRFDPAQHKKI